MCVCVYMYVCVCVRVCVTTYCTSKSYQEARVQFKRNVKKIKYICRKPFCGFSHNEIGEANGRKLKASSIFMLLIFIA